MGVDGPRLWSRTWLYSNSSAAPWGFDKKINKKKKQMILFIYLHSWQSFKGTTTNLSVRAETENNNKKQNKQLKYAAATSLPPFPSGGYSRLPLGFWKVTVTYCMCSDMLARKGKCWKTLPEQSSKRLLKRTPAGEERLLNYCGELSELNRAVENTGIDSMASSLWCATGAVLCTIWWTL